MFDELRDAEASKKPELHEAIAREIALNAFFLAVFHFEKGDIEDQSDGKAVFKQDSMLSFPSIRAEDGTPFFPVYTDWTELRKCEAYKTDEVKTLILSFDDIAAMTAGKSGIVVNPYSDQFIIRPEQVLHMKRQKESAEKGFSRQVVQKDTPVRIGDPSNFPSEMAKSIAQYAETVKTIRAIWLKLMDREGEKSYLVIADFEGDPDIIFKGISEAATPFLPRDLFLDMVLYASPFGRKAASGKPFYQRKKGLFRR